jgi:hypothetical protein
MAIVAAQSVSQFFLEAVDDAIRIRGVTVTEGAAQYLVALLADYAHPDRRAGEALDRPLTLLFDEAVHAPDPADRFERLRTLGDGVLYGCGFFGEHFAARGVDPKYLRGLGTRAYEAAGSMLVWGAMDEAAGQDLFTELADKFDGFVEVLSDVADATIAMGSETSRGLVKLYERWLRTGSERLAGALTARGVLPTRGPKGIVQ